MLDGVEALRPWHIERAQDQRVQHTENHGVGANGHSQRQNGDDCECGRLSQHAEAEARVLYQGLNEIAGERFAAFLFEAHVAAELDVGAAFRLGTMEAGTFQILRAVLYV